jgi:hypothetical protein
MSIVYKLNIELKTLLEGQEFKPNSKFNPIQDADGNWIISQEEVEQNENTDFAWINYLEPIEYKPLIIDVWQ